MNNNNNFETKWYKLDNTANIFPVISNKKISSVFRVSCILKQEIVPSILESSLNQTLRIFKNFKVKLKKGLFWYYFETNNNPVFIEEENNYPCSYIDTASNNQFLFKVTYFNKRINLDVFHALTDGKGSIDFLKAIILNYIKIANKDKLSDQALKTNCVKMLPNFEDSYNKNYKKIVKLKKDSKKAYQMKDIKMPLSIVSVIHGNINIDELIKICKKQNATITQYLTAVLIWCIYQEYLNGEVSKKPINITVPVNLRNLFGSTTSKNFFTILSISFDVNKNNYSFDEILEKVKKDFKKQLTKESLSNRIFSNVSFEKNVFFRSIPLIIKNIMLKTVYYIESKKSTSVISNLGKVEMPEEFEGYIDSFHMMIGATDSEPVKCGVCSYGNKLICTFTSKFECPYIERTFFRFLQSKGLNIVIESNGVHNEEL